MINLILQFFLSVATYYSSLYSPGIPKSRMILADRDEDPDNRNEIYEVSFTPYTGDGTGDQGDQ